jgi:hypothetical protein
MADDTRAKITLSKDDLEASLDSFLTESPEVGTRGRVVAAEDTVDLDCTSGATCNFKCGPTAYWECGPTSYEATCDTFIGTCYSCGYGCPTWYPDC